MSLYFKTKSPLKKRKNKLFAAVFLGLLIFLSFLIIFLVFKTIKKHYAKKFKITTIQLVTDKTKYYRYELIKVRLYLPALKDNPIINVQAKVYLLNPSNKKVFGVGNEEEKKMIKINNTQLSAVFAVPWNSQLGKYKVIAEVFYKQKAILNKYPEKAVKVPLLPVKIKYPEDKDKKLKNKIEKKVIVNAYKKTLTTKFEIAERKVNLPFANLSVLDIEASGPLLDANIVSPAGKIGKWENIFQWAEFLQVNTIWYLGGQTATYKNGNKLKDVWVSDNINIYPVLMKEAKKRNFKTGVWIASYLTFGNGVRLSKYNYSFNYDPKTDKLISTKSISPLDKNRLKDIINLVSKLNQNKNIDFVGLDYIRNSAGGYEMVDDFLNEMQILKPNWFNKSTKIQRIKWLARKITKERFSTVYGKDLYDKWNWWRAHLIASNIHTIVKQTNLKKPLWVFTLGWQHGYQHGQDPLMFKDAGADINAVMLYECNHNQFEFIVRDWKNYLKPNQVFLLAGNSLDWFLQDGKYDPAGPEEFLYRLKKGALNLNGSKIVLGTFLHDLSRGLWGRKGPYSFKEWGYAYKTAHSFLLQQKNKLNITIKLPAKAEVSKTFFAKLKIKNNSTENLKAEILPLNFENVSSVNTQNLIIDAQETKTLLIPYKINSLNNFRKNRFAVICEVKVKNSIYTLMGYINVK